MTSSKQVILENFDEVNIGEIEKQLCARGSKQTIPRKSFRMVHTGSGSDSRVNLTEAGAIACGRAIMR